ncbi:hypothetical protein AAAV72_15335, partial [Gemmiger formicilis]|uniref:Gldg family protein n=1 Tax=Gemmiger formicilis TaxID=745368 RepID=UPI0032D5670D
VPEDCDLLLMYAPTADLSEDEAQMLRDYLASGGKIMVIFGETGASELANLSGILTEYGMEPVNGYIADPSRCYQGNYFYIFPELSVSGDMAEGISTQMVLLTYAQGMNLADPERDTISVTDFMSSSDQAYAITEDAQTEGSYAIGATATETVTLSSGEDEDSSDTSADSEESEESEETAESRLTVITAGSLIDQGITDFFSQLENTQLFMNAVTANFEGVQNLSIEAKSLSVEYNTVQHAGLFSMIMIFGIPAVIL